MNPNPCTFTSDIAVARAIITHGVQTSSLAPYRWQLGRRAVILRKRLLAFPVPETVWVLELEGQAAKYCLGEHWRDPHLLPKFGGRQRLIAIGWHYFGHITWNCWNGPLIKPTSWKKGRLKRPECCGKQNYLPMSRTIMI